MKQDKTTDILLISALVTLIAICITFVSIEGINEERSYQESFVSRCLSVYTEASADRACNCMYDRATQAAGGYKNIPTYSKTLSDEDVTRMIKGCV